MISEIHASALRLAHLREEFEGIEESQKAYWRMMDTGIGCDLCKPGTVCFWHHGVKSAWPRKVGK